MPLPAHPWTVAAYVRSAESRYRLHALITQVRAIARVHLLSCCAPPDSHPIVIRTLSLIEARERTRGHRGSLFPEEECLLASAPGEVLPGRKAHRLGKSRRRTMAAKPRLVRPRSRS